MKNEFSITLPPPQANGFWSRLAMKVGKAERVLKETALEALEIAMQQNELVRRPKRGKNGWAAIEQAMVWWKGASWTSLPREEQDIDLRTVTAWKNYRAKQVLCLRNPPPFKD